MIRKFLSLSLLAILSFSSIGVPVFSHVCNGLDKKWTSILIPHSNCCSNAGIEKGNCNIPPESDRDCQVSKAPCCENEVAFAALNSKYTTLSQSLVTFLLSPALPGSPVEITESNPGYVQDLKFYASCDIPHRYGRSLLIFEQLFLC